jgi:hypothetical protein
VVAMIRAQNYNDRLEAVFHSPQKFRSARKILPSFLCLVISRVELIRKDKEKFRSARKIPPSFPLGGIFRAEHRLWIVVWNGKQALGLSYVDGKIVACKMHAQFFLMFSIDY